jgi:sulfite exporter TauE/SafE
MPLDFSSVIAAFPIFIASLLGSSHCVGMCGGFVALYAHNSPGKILPHCLYNLGRLVTYLILGVAAAQFGAAFNVMLPITALQHSSALVVGIVLIALGVVKLLGRNVRIGERVFRRISKLLHPISAPIFRTPRRITPFLIGMLTTLIPCGWLYVFVALAFSSGSPTEGALIMLFFWFGSLPAMVAYGAAVRVISIRLRQYAPQVMGVLLIFSGLISLTSHHTHQHHGHSAQEHSTTIAPIHHHSNP